MPNLFWIMANKAFFFAFATTPQVQSNSTGTEWVLSHRHNVCIFCSYSRIHTVSPESRASKSNSSASIKRIASLIMHARKYQLRWSWPFFRHLFFQRNKHNGTHEQVHFDIPKLIRPSRNKCEEKQKKANWYKSVYLFSGKVDRSMNGIGTFCKSVRRPEF